jgi:magnesium and cobalt transporter
VPDPHPSRSERHPWREDKRSLFQKITEFIHPGLESTDELIETLAEAEDNAVIDVESRVMLEGVLRLSGMTAGEAMVAAPRMDLLDIDAPYDELLYQIITTAHSRFPVYQGERENVIGILLAKDLLKLQRAPELNLRTLLRPAVFVPESKSLNDLLRVFRLNRNHLAMVVDEFGRTAGLITIEDVLEEIVGQIEDEFDRDEAEDGDIFALADDTWRVAGDTPLARVNEALGVQLSATPGSSDLDVAFDTVGGLIAHAMGHVPRRGERIDLGGLQFQVLLTKGGAVRWFKVTRAAADAQGQH